MSVATPAAGGVVWRRGADGTTEIAVVHRPRYDDWSLPKGKLERGETPLLTAVREVGEELGARVAVQQRLPDVRYRVTAGRKTVSYWAMRLLGDLPGGDVPVGDEVDDVEWLPPDAARARLSYDLDAATVERFAATPPVDSMVLLVRHAKAGKRSDWRGDDALRPLDFTGARQALQLVPYLRAFDVDRVRSAGLERCVQTVRRFADDTGLPIEVDDVYSDDRFAESPDDTVAAVRGAAEAGRVTAISSQGEVIPGVVRALCPDVRSPGVRKGAVWALTFAAGAVVAADYYDDPTAPRD